MAEIQGSPAGDDPMVLCNDNNSMSEEEEEEEEVENSSQSDYEDGSDSESDLNEEDSEFVEYLAKLRDSAKMKQILEIDGPLSASRVVKQYDEILAETATSINTDTRNDRPAQFRPLPVINSLREVSSQMMAFQASPDTPDGTACSSAVNAARQICYWSSLLMTIMDERNVVHPVTTMPSSTLEPSTSSTLSSSSSSASVLPSMLTTTSSSQPRPASSSNVPTSSVLQDHLPYSSSHQQAQSSVIDHQPPVSVSLQFQQNSLPCSTVSSNASCTVSPSLYSSSPLLSSTLSGQPPTMYSFCGQPALSSWWAEIAS